MKERVNSSFVSVAVVTVVLVCGLYFLLNLTSPLTAGPWGVLVVFILIYAISCGSILMVFQLVEKIYRLTIDESSDHLATNRLSKWHRRSYMLSAVLAFIPIFIISLNSISNLEIKDLLLIAMVVFILIFYIIRRY